MAAMLCRRDAADHKLASTYRHKIRYGNYRPCFVAMHTRTKVQAEGCTSFHAQKCLLGVLKCRKLICKKRQILACCRCTKAYLMVGVVCWQATIQCAHGWSTKSRLYCQTASPALYQDLTHLQSLCCSMTCQTITMSSAWYQIRTKLTRVNAAVQPNLLAEHPGSPLPTLGHHL